MLAIHKTLRAVNITSNKASMEHIYITAHDNSIIDAIPGVIGA